MFSILHLYLFADEYLILQLQHDAIIVFVEQCQTMEWRPDPDSELLAAAVKLLVRCLALICFVEPDQV